MASVTLKGIHKSYDDVDVIHDVDLDIADGEFVVFVGPSGCGKSTLLRMIAGLEDITGGDISIADSVVNEVAPSKRGVAMVFQSYALYPHMTVYRNMAFGLQQAKLPAGEIDQRVRAAAEVLHITDYLDRTPKALSGGQRQRVAIGRAIVREPEVFLFDEPLSNLDAKLRVSTRAQIKNLSHELAVTTIYVTHDQIEAMTLADRVVVMERGVVQQVGTPTEIYDRPANAFVAGFIGNPAMNLINGSLDGGTFAAEKVKIEGFKAPDGPITLGFRAEDATVKDSRKAEITAPIYTLELLGDATMVTARVAGELIAVRASKDFRAAIGDPVNLSVPSHICHLFDEETGARVGT